MLIGGWVAFVLAIVVVAAAAHAPSKISDQYHRFVNTGQASPTQDLRQSVFSSANRGIVDNWSVAVDAFKDSPLHGQGAGGYENYWNQYRPAKQAGYDVVDAHSLYAETLGELGAVGFALLVVAILTILLSLLPARRGGNRALYAAFFATALAWAVHAGVDWDWEMPAVTSVFFVLGGAGLATHELTWRPSWLSAGARVGIGLLLLAGAATPALVFVSQRQLNDARDALRAGHCGTAVHRAADAVDTLAARAEPYELMALCQQQRGRLGLAISAMRKATQQDPDYWRYHYELGVLLGGAGLDARPELVTAHRLNPQNADARQILADVPSGQAVNWDIDLLGPSGATAQRP